MSEPEVPLPELPPESPLNFVAPSHSEVCIESPGLSVTIKSVASMDEVARRAEEIFNRHRPPSQKFQAGFAADTRLGGSSQEHPSSMWGTPGAAAS